MQHWPLQGLHARRLRQPQAKTVRAVVPLDGLARDYCQSTISAPETVSIPIT